MKKKARLTSTMRKDIATKFKIDKSERTSGNIDDHER